MSQIIKPSYRERVAKPLHVDTPASNRAEMRLAEGNARSIEDQYADLKERTIMIVDDDLFSLELVQAFLADAGYKKLIPLNQSPRAKALIPALQPDLLLLDLMMPEVSGFDILEAMRPEENLRHMPVIVLTSSIEPEFRYKALSLGATDFLAKPVDPSELALRVRNNLVTKAYRDHLADYSGVLEHEVQKRTEEIEAAQLQIIHCLARASEFRDDDTGQHVIRVGRFSAVIARELGLPQIDVELIEVAAQLHDVGKIGVPDGILLKRGRLDKDEFAFIKKHSAMGYSIIEPHSNPEWDKLDLLTGARGAIVKMNTSPIMRMAASIALSHHEKWDGSGYPKGLKGEAIPIEGRITALADVYDALSSKRPYKDPFPREKCLAIIEEGRGSHFDPQVVDVFFEARDEIIAIQDAMSD